jgi:cell division initiation protein
MKLTPLDVQQQQFSLRFRGYDTLEIETFLDQVAETFESMTGDIEQLKEKIHLLEEENKSFKSKEETFRTMMVSSQETIREMKENAAKTSDLIIAQAELTADKIIGSAKEKLDKLYDDINELKRQKVQFVSKLQSVIKTHSDLLELTEADYSDYQENRIDHKIGEIKKLEL